MNIPSQQYVDERVEELKVAAGASDGDAVVAILGRMREDGDADFSDVFETRIVLRGLENLRLADIAAAATR